MKIFAYILIFIWPVYGEVVLTPRIAEANPESGSTKGTIVYESSWLRTKPLVVKRIGFQSSVKIRSLIYGENIFFQIKWRDETANMLHKPWFWDSGKRVYSVGDEREDSLVVRWEMVSEKTSRNSKNDLWYWGSVKTKDFADDMSEVISFNQFGKSLIRRDFLGGRYFWQYKGDSGQRCYRTEFSKQGFMMRPGRYVVQKPNGSRSDVAAMAIWKNNEWTLELKRKLSTGNIDDLEFQWGKDYFFDVASSLENAHIIENRMSLGEREKQVLPISPKDLSAKGFIDWYEYSAVIANYIRNNEEGLEKRDMINLVDELEEIHPLTLRIPEDFHSSILEDVDESK